MLIASAKNQRRLVIIGFLILPLTLLTLFSIYPFFQLIWFSLTDWNGLSPDKAFVGLQNYSRILFDDQELLTPLINSVYYFIGSIIQLALATYFAVILNRGMPGSNLFRMLLFMPFVLNSVAVSMVFRYFLQIDGGLDSLLHLVGLDMLKQEWVQNPAIVKWSLVFASVWRYLGFQLLITYGALQSVPTDQYEAAQIEGAGEWHQFLYITLPSIAPVLGLQLILSTVGSLEVFEVPFLITQGANGTKTFVMATIEEAFEFRRVGVASAMAVILLCFVMISIIAQRTLFDREGEK
ncbi:sugar ABC transporter permease [uncultured Cohaesibacter sp.]|uniref:carbohydrate ABC transporter permease n=1 Tax=uncultured Cohaesibacter sp. TaxID=1002546 RepID=UPI00292ED5E5|nr:sugar ABC transporter permease [uncultured Cohaesibacter sp.]